MTGSRAVDLALAAGRKAGADEIEVYRREEAQCTVRVREGRVEQYVTARTDGIGVRIFRGSRAGFFWTSLLEREEITGRIRAVLDALPSLPDDPAVGPAGPGECARSGRERDTLRIFDPRIERLDLAARAAWIAGEERAARRIHRDIRTDYFLYEDIIARTTLASTLGLRASYRETSCVASGMANVRKGAKGGSADVFRVHRSFEGLQATPLGAVAAERALVQLRGRPLSPRRTTVVYGPEPAADLVRLLGEACSAEAVQKGESFLTGRLGRRAAPAAFSLVDDPLVTGAPGSRPFDDEGIPSRPVTLFERGVLGDLLYDVPSARRDRRSSNGHASRSGCRATPVISPTNLVVAPGRTRVDRGIAGIREGLLVLQATDTGGASSATGDYSVEAYGYRIVRGCLAEPVSGVTIASTLPEMLRHLAWVGDDPAWHGAVLSPTLAIEGMTIAG